MSKLQFLNTTFDLLTKNYYGKNQVLLTSWYEVQTCTRDTTWKGHVTFSENVFRSVAYM